jgi:hypothetical protein
MSEPMSPTTEVVIIQDTDGEYRMELRPIHQTPPVVSSEEAQRVRDEVIEAVQPQSVHPLLKVDYEQYDYETGSGHYVSLNLPLRASVHTGALKDDPEGELNEAFSSLEQQLERSTQLLRARRRTDFKQSIITK